jgi:hypothetical protein
MGEWIRIIIKKILEYWDLFLYYFNIYVEVLKSLVELFVHFMLLVIYWLQDFLNEAHTFYKIIYKILIKIKNFYFANPHLWLPGIWNSVLLITITIIIILFIIGFLIWLADTIRSLKKIADVEKRKRNKKG